ncbi:MAG: hypothetical protein IJI25_06805 [Eubacterium sp.]|nr:hypothetical protein [Eubacterium sp.]
MTDRFFADYNRNMPEHPMTAPVGVDYVFAVRELCDRDPEKTQRDGKVDRGFQPTFY